MRTFIRTWNSSRAVISRTMRDFKSKNSGSRCRATRGSNRPSRICPVSHQTPTSRPVSILVWVRRNLARGKRLNRNSLIMRTSCRRHSKQRSTFNTRTAVLSATSLFRKLRCQTLRNALIVASVATLSAASVVANACPFRRTQATLRKKYATPVP